MNGGIYNAALFGASQREARGKLEQMAGIKRPPSGILASSTELMNAVGSAAAPAMPVRATGPATPMTPAPVPMVQAALPQVAAPTTVTPGPVQQAPASRPTAPAMMQEGGPVDVRKTPTATDPLGVFVDTVDALGAGIYDSLLKRYGSPEKAKQAVVGQVNAVQAAVDSGSAENAANTVIDQAGLPVTDESKKEFASSVLGIDTDDIGEIDDAIFRTLTADVTLSGKELQKAVLLGLQNYKQTASARAAGTSGGVKSANYRSAKNAYQDAFTQAMGVSDTEIPEGMTKEQYATQFAETVVRRTYTPEQIAAAGITMGSIPSGGGKSGPTLEEFLVEAQKINPDSSVEELTEFWNKRYGG